MKNRAVQIYGYVVCFVAVITFLITVAQLVTSIIDLGDPFRSSYQYTESLSSFESYKVEAMKSIQQNAAYIPNDSTLREMYQSAKDELVARQEHNIKRNIVVNSISLVISVLLFFIHWKYIVKRAE